MNLRKNKRSYTPSVDDIRDYNAKRCKIFSSFGSLSLDNHSFTNLTRSESEKDIDISSIDQPLSSVEVINDIDEYLLANQSDEEIIQSNQHYFINDLSSYHITQTDQENLILNKKWTQRLTAKQYTDWALIRYAEPWSVIYKMWEPWFHKNQRYFLNPSDNNYTYHSSHQFAQFNTQSYYQNMSSHQSIPKIYEIPEQYSSYKDQDQDTEMIYEDDDYIQDEILRNGLVEEPSQEYCAGYHYPKFDHLNTSNNNPLNGKNKGIAFGNGLGSVLSTSSDTSCGIYMNGSFGKIFELGADQSVDYDMDIEMDGY